MASLSINNCLDNKEISTKVLKYSIALPPVMTP